jgi:hypothetical protein
MTKEALMKNRILCLALCLLLLVVLASCETVEDTFPIFEFEQSDAWVDVDNATMTMKFASEDNRGNGWRPNNLLVIYVSKSDQPLDLDYEEERVSDYRAIEGYTVVAEYDRDELGSKYSAYRLPFDNLLYSYSQEITIPSEYLQGEQGELHFYLCDVSGWQEIGYMMLTLRYIKNVKYQIKDGQVMFDFESCVIKNPRRH